MSDFIANLDSLWKSINTRQNYALMFSVRLIMLIYVWHQWKFPWCTTLIITACRKCRLYIRRGLMGCEEADDLSVRYEALQVSWTEHSVVLATRCHSDQTLQVSFCPRRAERLVSVWGQAALEQGHFDVSTFICFIVSEDCLWRTTLQLFIPSGHTTNWCISAQVSDL